MAGSRFLFFCTIRAAASVSTDPSSAPEESPVNYNEIILILTLQGQKYPRISMNVIFIKVVVLSLSASSMCVWLVRGNFPLQTEQ